MKPKALAMMGVALACGLVAAYMTSQLIAEKKEEVEVLKAKAQYNQYSVLRDPDGMFEKIMVKKNEARANYVVPTKEEMDKVKSRTFKRTIMPGETLAQEDLLSKDASGITLDKGKVAMSVPISPLSAVGGHVVPGAHVNILHSRQHSPATLLLEDVLVRAIDLNTERSEEKRGMLGITAILEVDIEQALKLQTAVNNGTISLILRSSEDPPKSTEKVAAAAPPPPPPPIELVRPKEIEKPTEVETVTQPPQERIELHRMVVQYAGYWDEWIYEINDKGKVIRCYLYRTNNPNKVLEAAAKTEQSTSESKSEAGTEKKPENDKKPESEPDKKPESGADKKPVATY